MKCVYTILISLGISVLMINCSPVINDDQVIDDIIVDDPEDEENVLIIGDLTKGTVYQHVYSPALEITPTINRSNILSLDVDDDQIDDVTITHTYEHDFDDYGEDSETRRTTKTRILLTPSSEHFQFCIRHVVDTTFSCNTEYGPDFDLYEYTPNLEHVCNENTRTFEIAQIIKKEYVTTFSSGDLLNNELPWYSGYLKFCKQLYMRHWDGMHNVTGVSVKDLRLGLKDWYSPAYVAFRKTEGDQHYFGYLKIKMVQTEIYSWNVQILEPVIIK